MNKNFYVIIVAALVIIASQSLYILDQNRQSVILRFGEPKNHEVEPGLKGKIPFIDQVLFFDKRILDLNAEPKEVIASDQKRLIVDSFAKFRILNALTFYQTVRNELQARNRLNSILESSVRQVLGSVPLNSVLQEGLRQDIMQNIKNIMNKEAKDFGIEIIDVRIMRADLPEKNSEAIYRRMQTEREREAKEFRAEGAEEAKKITAKAEREKIEIIANANKESDIIRGKADAIAIKIFADAYSTDKEFFAFYKSMTSYKDSLAKSSTKILISPDSEFFQYFNSTK